MDYEKAHIDISESLKKIRRNLDAAVREGKMTIAQANQQYDIIKKHIENSLKTDDTNAPSSKNDETNTPDKSDRDAIISRLNDLGALAQQYFKKPLSYGGGGNSFIGWVIPEPLVKNVDGYYEVNKINNKEIELLGIGNQIGKDGQGMVKVTMIVGSDNIISTSINN